MNKGPSVSPLLATGVLCLLIGAIVGFYFGDTMRDPGANAASRGAGSGAGSGGGSGGLPPPPGFKGADGQVTPSPSASELPRLVRSLDTVQKVQNQGLTPAQSQQILPLLKAIQAADKLPGPECDAKLAAIETALTPEQKRMLADLQPQRGGGRGAGGGKAAGGGGAKGGPIQPMGMGGGGGGGQQDPEKPFASERNKAALDDLISHLENQK